MLTIQSVDKIILNIIEREGGYVDDPDDSGGATKYGISLRFYQENIDKGATKDTIKNLDTKEAAAIYKKYFFEPYFSKLIGTNTDFRILENLMDIAVMSGGRRAIKQLHASLGIVTMDVVIGPITLDSLKSKDQELILAKLKLESIYYYNSLAQGKKKNIKYLIGWISRRQKT